MTPGVWMLWCHAVNAEEAVKLLQQLPGNVGGVLNRTNYEAALLDPDRPWVARVENVRQAREVAVYAQEGARWRYAIIKDERNISGLSGQRLEPEEYGRMFYDIARPLMEADVPAQTMGLAMLADSVWDDILQRRRFDHEYHAQLPLTYSSGFNPGHTTRREVEGALRTYPDRWLLSPHPYTFTWEVAIPYIVERFIRRLTLTYYDQLRKERGCDVALWSLQQHMMTLEGRKRVQDYHSIYHMDGSLTELGRRFVKVLEGS